MPETVRRHQGALAGRTEHDGAYAEMLRLLDQTLRREAAELARLAGALDAHEGGQVLLVANRLEQLAWNVRNFDPDNPRDARIEMPVAASSAPLFESGTRETANSGEGAVTDLGAGSAGTDTGGDDDTELHP